MENNSFNSVQRTEEVQDIIERMPQKFGRNVTMLVLLIIITLLSLGWLVRYPDVVIGQVTINSNSSTVRLISPNSGKLILYGVKSQEKVKTGQIIGYIDNQASLKDIVYVSTMLSKIQLDINKASSLYSSMFQNLSLGEVRVEYFTFLNCLKQLSDYQNNKLFDKQEQALQKLLQNEHNIFQGNTKKTIISRENLQIVERFFKRDSSLFIGKVLTEADFDHSKINRINAITQYQSSLVDIENDQEQISQTESKIKEIEIQKNEKESQLHLELIKAYNDLQNAVKSWKHNYLFESPFNGRVQYVKFWNNNEFVQSGEPIFTIVPRESDVLGEVILPAAGAGKVHPGQEVIVKLEDYPYMEYGSVQGVVANIALTTNASKSQNGDIQTYLVTIKFPNQLKTNYGSQLIFKYETKGTAEIITKDRKLIYRFFDNLKYISKK